MVTLEAAVTALKLMIWGSAIGLAATIRGRPARMNLDSIFLLLCLDDKVVKRADVWTAGCVKDGTE